MPRTRPGMTGQLMAMPGFDGALPELLRSRRLARDLVLYDPQDVRHDAVELEVLRRVDGGDAGLLEHGFIVGRNDAADDDRHVVETRLAILVTTSFTSGMCEPHGSQAYT